ncbi:LytTR family DNA-binding domain-containing protein [Lacihabitans lacunae]|uniref:LytTR family DNA-binding domain-containing protein n=1 Tax=Lacihabitans lacunae TaxID=1028214 RepID=A0ABV7Z1W0_9BACT
MINITPKFIKSIDSNSLLYLDAQSNYTFLTFKNGHKKLYSYHLKVFENSVLPNNFIRVSRSKLINITYINRTLKNGSDLYVILQDETRVLIPRKRRKELIAKFPEIFGI